MPNPIRNVSFTDYDIEFSNILRRQKLAQAMMQGALTPFGSTEFAPGGFAVRRSPMEGVGRLAQAASGAMLENRENERAKALAERLRGDRQADYAALMGGMQGSPGRPEEVMPQGVQGPPQPAQQAIPSGQINPAIIAQLRTPEAQSAAMQMLMQQAKPQQIGSGGLMMPGGNIVPPAARPETGFTLAPGQTRYGTSGQPIVSAPQKDEWSEPYQMGGAWVQRNPVTGQVRQSVGREPQVRIENPPAVTVTEIEDPENPNRTIKVDARTGRLIGKGPKLTETGKLETKRQFNMQGIGGLIQQAEDLLSGVQRDEAGVIRSVPTPTGSGIGAAYDVAAGWLGASPTGAVEAQQMKAIGGALTAKMPRMEGPQSDRDVQLYREMAAQVGDPTVPIDRRKAALTTVKQLWLKYERLNPEAFAERRTISEPPPGAVRPR